MNAHGLVAAIRRKPTGAAEWRAWYELVYPRVYCAAFHLARRNVESARDLVQEALARFLKYNGIARVTTDAESIAYLLTICRNIAASRADAAREVPLDEFHPVLEGAVVEQAGDVELVAREIVRDLPPDDQRVMQWTADGVPLAEIAQRLKIPYTVAGVRVHRLKNFIRRRLGL